MFQQGTTLRRLGGICKVDGTAVVVERCEEVVVFVIDRQATLQSNASKVEQFNGVEQMAAVKGLGSQQSK